MTLRRGLLATALLLISITALHAQVSTRLVGQDKLSWRRILEGPNYFDSLILTFGTEPVVVSAEFRLTYGRLAAPETGTIELVITGGPDNTTIGTLPLVRPLARKALTIDEFVDLGTSEAINVEDLNIELILVDSQRGGILRQAAKWSGRR